MVYLAAAAIAVAVTSLLTSFYGIWALNRLPQSGLEDELRDIKGDIHLTGQALSEQSQRVHDLSQSLPVIRAEVAEALTRVDSRFNAVRASEERARRMAREAAEEEGEGTLSEEEFLALTAQSEQPEQDSHQLTWPDLERLAFERRNQGRR